MDFRAVSVRHISTRRIFDEIDKDRAEVLSYNFIAELDGIALHYFSIYKKYPLAEIKAHLTQKYA